MGKEGTKEKLDIELEAPADFTSPEVLYQDLVKTIHKYHPSDDISMIEKAYKIAANKSRQNRNHYLKGLYKHKNKRSKYPKAAYVRLKCVNRPEIALKTSLEHKQTQKYADHNGTVGQPFI